MRFKRLTALVATSIIAASLFTGCSEKDPSKVINVFNLGEYIDEDLIGQFEEETGYKVNYSTFDTNEAMYQKVKANPGIYDVIVTSDYMIEKMISEDLIEKIDYNNVPNYTHINEDFKNQPYDPTNEHSVPYAWGTVGIIYDKTIVKEPVTSWDVLWDEQYKGNVYMYNSLRDAMLISLIRNGYSQNTTNIEEIQVAKNDLIDQLSITSPIYVIDEVRDNMISGEKALAVVYSGDASYIMSNNENIEYAIPEEGSNKWIDGLFIPKGAPNKTGAESFINFLCDPEVAKTNMEYIEYSTPNLSAYELLDDSMKNDSAAYPSKEILDNCEGYVNLDIETLKLYEDAFTEVLSK